MKIKSGFALRKICRENIICATGLENINFNKMITLNQTAADIFEYVCGKEFDVEKIAAFLKETYPEVELERLIYDSETLVSSWKEAGIIED